MIRFDATRCNSGNARRGRLLRRAGAWRQPGYRKCRSRRNAPHDWCYVDGSPKVLGKKRPPRTDAFRWSVFGLGLGSHRVFRALLTHVHPISCSGRRARSFAPRASRSRRHLTTMGHTGLVRIIVHFVEAFRHKMLPLLTENKRTICPSRHDAVMPNEAATSLGL